MLIIKLLMTPNTEGVYVKEWMRYKYGFHIRETKKCNVCQGDNLQLSTATLSHVRGLDCNSIQKLYSDVSTVTNTLHS